MSWKRTGKRLLAIGMAIILTFSGLSTGGLVDKVYAAEEWIGITDATELKSINLSANYKLLSDIDLSGEDWTPIGTFTGKLDGNGKVIRNLTISNTTLTGAGLFTAVGAGAQIYNLGIEGANITTGDNTGALAGTNNGTISKVYAKGSISGQNNVGGLVGSNTGTIENSFASASVSGKDKVGGLVGANSGTVNRTYAASEIEASVFSNYLEFNGTSGYISIPHHADYDTGTFTLEAWFQWDDVTKPESTDPNAYVDFIIGKGVEKFEIHTEGGSGRNGVRFIPIQNVNGDSHLDIKDVLQPGWFHVAAAYSYDADSQTASASFFINGVAQDIWQKGTNVGKTATMSRLTAPSMGTADINIGRRTDGSYPFKGKIADVRFWNIARTEEQIAADKDKKLTGSEEGLVGYWKLDEASGPAIDSTSRGNNGTLIGGITRTQIETTNKGGLVGENTGNVSNSYYDSDISGQSDTGKGEPETTEAMKLEGTFNTWDFAAVWGIETGINGGYPYLLSASKDITSFSFSGLDPVVAGVVDESAKTIALTVPFGTDVTALIPAIVHTGASISPDSEAQQDFSAPVTYTVTAADGSTQNYTVTVTVSPEDFPGGEGSLNYPYGVAVDSSGNIYVANNGNDTITKMNSSGAVVDTLTGINSPWGVALDSSGNIYAANYANDTVTKMNSNGDVVDTFTFPFMSSPTGVALDNSGNYLYVALEGSGIVTKIDSISGTVEGLFTSPSFTAPAGVAVDSIGNIYVADTMGNTITKMNSSGAVDATFTSPLLSNQYPVGVAVDGSDNLYVSYQDYDATLGYVIKMDSNTGEIADTYDGLVNPHGIAVDSSGNIYVAEAFDSTIKKISPDTTAPTISSVDVSPVSATNGDVTVTVTVSAADASGIAAAGGYSFDGGASWQDGNSKTYSSNTTIASGSIKVKDTAGNIASYGIQIDITNIDTTPPTLTSGVVSRISDTSGTVKFTSDETGEYYYEIVDDDGPTPSINTTGTGTSCSAGEATIALTGLSAGAKDIYIKVKDEAGNVSNALKMEIGAYINPADAAIAEAKALLPESYTATEGSTTNLLDYLNGITGMSDTGVTLSLVSSNVNVADDGIITYTGSEVTGDVEVHINKVDGTEDVKTISVTISALPVTEEQKVAADKAALIWEMIKGSNTTQNSVIYDLNLTVTGAVYGSDISWTSSDTTIVSNKGVVTRPAFAAGDANLTVTASIYYNDAGDTREFDLRVLKQAASTKAALSSLTVSGINLSPSFSANVTDYNGSAGSGTSSITITPVAADVTATVEVNGNALTGESATVPLSPGNNTIAIKVTAQDGTTQKTYTLSVYRAYDGSSDENDRDSSPPLASTTPTEQTKPAETGVEILINGKTETAATASTTIIEDKTVTTITIDKEKVDEKLQQEGNNAVVTIPAMNNADVVIGSLNGQTVKNMEMKEAVLEIKTENVTYTLPASQINIDNISSQLGEQAELKDIAVSIKISEPSTDTVKIVEDTANKNNYQIIVKPVEFEITCTSGNRTVEVSKFNGYVERTLAVPDGVDPSKITTGIVLNEDGTFSHVPTSIVVINGKYYAKINSLTNSTYSLIWNPRTFKDVENHWAENDINDMGSRLVIEGDEKGTFEPDGEITRAEFAAIVVRALGLMRSGTGKYTFSDVPKEAWYYDAVSIAYENGLVSGYGNGEFEPLEKITREQAITMVARAMGITGLKAELKADEVEKLLESFSDSVNSADYTKANIAACVKAGIISGRGNNLIAPKENITRAEAAAIIKRLLQKSDLI